MLELTWLTALIGGMLIGLSATLLLAINGRIAGISGILNGIIRPAAYENWRVLFVIGMLAGGILYEYGLAATATPRADIAPWAMIVGGLLVGFGTRMGNGCTSGHGVCGLGRLSVRSLVAVITFLSVAIVTVFVMRHLLGIS